jgi:hypothetical protein
MATGVNGCRRGNIGRQAAKGGSGGHRNGRVLAGIQNVRYEQRQIYSVSSSFVSNRAIMFLHAAITLASALASIRAIF